jgi:hypothetical protein
MLTKVILWIDCPSVAPPMIETSAPEITQAIYDAEWLMIDISSERG